MAVALRLFMIFAVLAFSGCFKTELPGYANGKFGQGKYSTKKHPKTYANYTVRRGDTLYSIGKRFGVDHKLLARRNHIRQPYTIYVGQRLSLTKRAARPSYIPMLKKKSPKRHALTRPRQKTLQPKKKLYRQAAINGVKSFRLRWPVNGPVTSGFGRRKSRMHDGIDIGVKEGTPVHAAASGEVVYSKGLSSYGNLVLVRHSKDLFTAYAHNQKNLVHKGDKVKMGDVIARAGKTGRTNGRPNLHFEVRRGETPVDPLAYLPRK